MQVGIGKLYESTICVMDAHTGQRGDSGASLDDGTTRSEESNGIKDGFVEQEPEPN